VSQTKYCCSTDSLHAILTRITQKKRWQRWIGSYSRTFSRSNARSSNTTHSPIVTHALKHCKPSLWRRRCDRLFSRSTRERQAATRQAGYCLSPSPACLARWSTWAFQGWTCVAVPATTRSMYKHRRKNPRWSLCLTQERKLQKFRWWFCYLSKLANFVSLLVTS